MSAFIAVASMELRFRDLVQYQDGIVSQRSAALATSLRFSASKYLHVALQGLSALLDRVSRPNPDAKDLEALFATWFLIIQCGIYDADMVETSQVHLNGIRQFINQYLRKEGAIDELPPAAQQLLLFILYVFLDQNSVRLLTITGILMLAWLWATCVAVSCPSTCYRCRQTLL